MIFLAVAAACAAAAATPGDENRTVIKLGWLGFESTPVEADLATAFLSAVAAINLHPAVHLGDATMRVEPYLYQHGATTRITGYGSDPERLDTYRVLGRRQAFMLASGPGCLDSTYAHGETGIDVDAIVTDNAGEDAAQWLTIAEAFGKPVVSSIASSDALSDKELWPTFSRVIPTDSFEAMAWARVFQRLGYRRIGMLQGTGDYAVALARKVETACAALGIEVVATITVPPTADLITQTGMRAVAETASDMKLKFTRLNVKVYLVTGTVAFAPLAAAIGLFSEMRGPGYVICTASRMTIPVAGITIRYLWSHIAQLVLPLLTGSIGMQPFHDAYSPGSEELWEAWPKNAVDWGLLKNSTARPARINATLQPNYVRQFISGWSHYTWDATLLTARGMADALRRCPANSTGAYSHNRPDCALQCLRNVSLVGATGPVRLTASGDRFGSYVLTNFDNGQTKEVGSITFATEAAESAQANVDIRSIVWSDHGRLRSEAPQWGQVTLAPTTSPTHTPTSAPTASPSKADPTPQTIEVLVNLPSEVGGEKSNDGLSAGLAIVITFGCFALGYLLWSRRRARRKSRVPADFEAILARLAKYEHFGGLTRPSVGDNAESPDSVSTDEAAAGGYRLKIPLELKRTEVVLHDVIGEGQFGSVSKGMWMTQVGRATAHVPVAVKMLQDPSIAPTAQLSFLEEAAATWQFRHVNVVEMYGVVTAGFPHLLVLELCELGSLLAYVKAEERPPAHLLQILHGVATGMAYLASVRFVHRDLAARNVVLDAAAVPKISDFGLGRSVDGVDYYRVSTETLLPIRWTDPVAIEEQLFTEATDVWSFGVTAVEVYNRGARPYGGCGNLAVLERLREGHRLGRPMAMPRTVYTDVVCPCWTAVADDGGNRLRPTFADLAALLAVLCEDANEDIGGSLGTADAAGVVVQRDQRAEAEPPDSGAGPSWYAGCSAARMPRTSDASCSSGHGERAEVSPVPQPIVSRGYVAVQPANTSLPELRLNEITSADKGQPIAPAAWARAGDSGSVVAAQPHAPRSSCAPYEVVCMGTTTAVMPLSTESNQTLGHTHDESPVHRLPTVVSYRVASSGSLDAVDHMASALYAVEERTAGSEEGEVDESMRGVSRGLELDHVARFEIVEESPQI